MANEHDSICMAKRSANNGTSRTSRARIACIAGVLIAVARSSSASAETVAGAEAPSAQPAPAPKPAARPAPKVARAQAAPAAPAYLVASAGPPPASNAAMSDAASMSSAAPSAPVANTTVNVVTAGTLACIPDCRSGYVCREGECVSACNPQCGEGEMCNAKRECVPRTEANDPYPYDKTRFGIGGAFGVNSSADGTGTPFGGVVGVAIPMGGHWYSREDIVVTYAKTSTDDRSYVGSTVSQNTTSVDQSYLLVALRATAGYQVSSLVSARVGAIAGSHTLTTQHGFCGNGYAERDASSFAIGGTGALGVAFKHIDLSAVIDAYSAETQQLCSVAVNAFGGVAGQPATLVPQRQFAAQFLAQATILF